MQVRKVAELGVGGRYIGRQVGEQNSLLVNTSIYLDLACLGLREAHADNQT